MKRVHGAVIGVMAMVLSGGAFAQGMYGGSSANDPNAASSSSMNAPSTDISSSFKSTELKGMSVENRQNQKLGSISDLIIDKDGKVSNVVLRESGLRGHQYLVPWDRVQLNPGDKVAYLDVNKDQLSSEFSAMEENKGATEKGKETKKKSAKKGEKEKTEKPVEETGKPSGTAPPPSTGGK